MEPYTVVDTVMVGEWIREVGFDRIRGAFVLDALQVYRGRGLYSAEHFAILPSLDGSVWQSWRRAYNLVVS